MTQPHDTAEIEARLRKAIQSTRAVMLGVVGGPLRHFNPMKGYTIEGEKPVWFLSKRDAELALETGEGHAAMAVVVSEDHHLHASVGGALSTERDQARIDQLWSSMADAWLPEGRTSPDVVLLRFDPEEAEVWLSDNAFKLAWEVAKANYTGQRAQSGERAHIEM